MRRDPLAHVAILSLTAIWGYNWVPIKKATHDADPVSVSATSDPNVGAKRPSDSAIDDGDY